LANPHTEDLMVLHLKFLFAVSIPPIYFWLQL
jgi:hypothetical protein